MMTKCPAKEAKYAYYQLWLKGEIESPTVENVSDSTMESGLYRVLFSQDCYYLIRLPEDAEYLSFVRGFGMSIQENPQRFMQVCCAELAKPILNGGVDAWAGSLRVEGPDPRFKVERIKLLLALIETLGYINEHIKEGGYQGRLSDHNRQHLPGFFKYLEDCQK